jgi:hypothetical protein
LMMDSAGREREAGGNGPIFRTGEPRLSRRGFVLLKARGGSGRAAGRMGGWTM